MRCFSRRRPKCQIDHPLHEPQDGVDFEKGSHALARRLNLTTEWWSINSVLDRTAGPCHPPGYYAHDAFYRCRHVRIALLEAAEEAEQAATEPTGEAA
jgi:hypothetical protein